MLRDDTWGFSTRIEKLFRIHDQFSLRMNEPYDM
jgi:hypothetical protein